MKIVITHFSLFIWNCGDFLAWFIFRFFNTGLVASLVSSHRLFVSEAKSEEESHVKKKTIALWLFIEKQLKHKQRNFIWLKAARCEQRGKIKLHFSNIGHNNKGNVYLSYNRAKYHTRIFETYILHRNPKRHSQKCLLVMDFVLLCFVLILFSESKCFSFMGIIACDFRKSRYECDSTWEMASVLCYKLRRIKHKLKPKKVNIYLNKTLWNKYISFLLKQIIKSVT